MSPIPIPISISPKEIFQHIRSLSAWLTNKNEKQLLEMQTKARNERRLYDFLAHLYSDYPVLEYNAMKFPIALFPSSKTQRYDLESVLGDLDIEREEIINSELQQAGQEYLKILLRSSKPPWEDPTYRVLEYNLGETFSLSCGLGNYFNMLKTCDVLEFEILTEFGKKYPPFPCDFREFMERLKLRHYLHSISDPIREVRGRSVAISASTFIIYAQDNTYKALVRERSSKVAVHQNLLHIIPSFMFQPVVRCYEDEYSIRHNIYREYLEELFGRRDLDRPSEKLSHNFFYEDPNLQYLEKLEKEGSARFFFTGISINLLNLRPEIHTLLLITDPEWISNQGSGRKIGEYHLDPISINWEFKHGDELAGAKFERTASVDLEDNLKMPQLFKPENFVPVGAAGMKLGIDVAKEELGLL